MKLYLFKALRNAIQHYRQYQQRFSNVDAAEWGVSLPDHFTAEAYLLEKESFAAVAQQIQKQFAALPAREREAMYLRFYKGMEVQEIAGIMGVTRQSVSNFLQKALLKLRTRWMVPLTLCLLFS